jgi:NADH:ubiquinone oxidoreductase subunit 6 (subunit J)
MMLNIKLAELQESYFSFIPISLVFGFVFLTELLFLFRSEFVFLDIFNENSLYFLTEFLNTASLKTSFDGFFGSTPNLKTLATSIFNDHLFFFSNCGLRIIVSFSSRYRIDYSKDFCFKSPKYI